MLEADVYSSLGVYVIPGQKLCPNCKIHLSKLKKAAVTSTYEKQSSDDDADPIYISTETDEDESLNATLNTTLNVCYPYWKAISITCF